MGITVAELKTIIHCDDREVRRSIKHIKRSLKAIRAEAEAIKKLQPGAADEVNAVLDGIEKMTRVEVRTKDSNFS